MKRYTREELFDAFDDRNTRNINQEKIIADLWRRVQNEETLSLAEAECICRFLSIAKPVDPTEQPITFNTYKACENYAFKLLYLIYNNNLNGAKLAHDHKGIISIKQKKLDIENLDKIYQDWLLVISKFNHNEQLLNYIAKEANTELKELKKIFTKASLGYNAFIAQQKAITLHSKYIYLTVKEVFEECDAEEVCCYFSENIIEINPYSMVHIMFRHYAGVAKQFDTKKSFHLDTSIDYKKLPFFLKEILEKIASSGKYKHDSLHHIPFKFKKQIYSIWTKQCKKFIKGRGETDYIRLETFYPVAEVAELNKLKSKYCEVPIDGELSIFNPIIPTA